MHVADVEFYGRTVWRLREPEVEILSLFARFEEEDVVAGVEVCEGVEGAVVVVAGFCVEFRVEIGVWEEVVEVLEEVSVSVSGLAWVKRRGLRMSRT